MKPTSQASQSSSQLAILKKLFPRGINQAKIWSGFVAILGGEEHEPLSVDMLEAIADRKFKLKQRIIKNFPRITDMMEIIFQCDIDLLRRITQKTWVFPLSHRDHAKDAIVLHGQTPEEIFLDWAAQSVITMLLGYIKANI